MNADCTGGACRDLQCADEMQGSSLLLWAGLSADGGSSL